MVFIYAWEHILSSKQGRGGQQAAVSRYLRATPSPPPIDVSNPLVGKWSFINLYLNKCIFIYFQLRLGHIVITFFTTDVNSVPS
jgi:hypothetical protein